MQRLTTVTARKRRPPMEIKPGRSNYRNPARPRKEFPRLVFGLAPELKEALEKEAYSQGISVARLVEDILKARYGR